MAEFVGIPVSMTPLNKRDWRIEASFLYYSNHHGVIQIPARFVTDFASVPRILWSIYPPWGDYGFAAVLHDYLYRIGSIPIKRYQADWIMFEAMGPLNVALHDRCIIYTGVRAGGWWAWSQDRRVKCV